MSKSPLTVEERAKAYLHDDTLIKQLGAGMDGSVYATSRNSAIKVFSRRSSFRNEIEAYERLTEHRVTDVKGVAVPRLMGSDESLGVIEMSIVRPPCLFDFASARFDFPPDFEQEAWDLWFAQKEEEFEADWPRASAIYQHLIDRHGIYFLDLAPRNLRFKPSGTP